MASGLDPYIRAKLLAFRARFRGLVFLRGFCCGVLALLGGLLILSLADYLIVMEDRARYVLSTGMYLTAMLITWIACIRPLLRVLDNRELAAMMEREEPVLKSKLLSAVELAEESSDHESELFRKQAQRMVIEDLHGLEMGRLLPAKLVRVWLIAAVVVVLVTGAMTAFSSGRTLLVRALVPMANIDRVSRNKILVLTPEGGDVIWAENSDEEIIIQVRGPKLKEMPFLFVEWGEGQKQKAAFKPATGQDVEDKYITSVAVKSQDMVYRIHAGDAVSRRYTVRSKQRPQIISYEKLYDYPNYTRRNTVTKKEDNGNLDALVGTKVKLVLHLNQPVKTATMRLIAGSVTNNRVFIPINAKKWELNLENEFAKEGNDSYKVDLNSTEGLENNAPVEYFIRAKSDEKPKVKIIQPDSGVTKRPEFIIQITGEVADDIGLEKLEQQYRVNQAEWKTVPTNYLSGSFPTNKVVKFGWDLLDLDELKTNDEVETRLVVTDRGGSRLTKSLPVWIKVDSEVLTDNRTRNKKIGQIRNLVGSIEQAVKATEKFLNALPEDLKDLKEPKNISMATDAIDNIRVAQGAWNQAVDEIVSSATNAQPGREAETYRSVGRLSLRLEKDWLYRAVRQLRVLNSEPVDTTVRYKESSVLLDKLRKQIDLINRMVSTVMRMYLAADEAALIMDYLDYIERDALTMHRVARAEKKTKPDVVWKRLVRSQKGVGKALAAAIKILEDLGKRSSEQPDLKKKFQKVHDDLKEAHQKLVDKHASATEPDETFLQMGVEWAQAISRSRASLRELAKDASKGALDEQGKLTKEDKDSSKVIGVLIEHYERKKDEGDELLFGVNITQDILRGYARLESTSGDPLYPSNLIRAAESLGVVSEWVQVGEDPGKVKGRLKLIADAMLICEAAHELSLLTGAVKGLAERERWKDKATDANSLRPQDWRWVQQRLLFSKKKLKGTGLAVEGKLDDLIKEGAAARTVDQEMTERLKKSGFFRKPNQQN